MLSFKSLSEKKTKVKINPRQSEITEKNGTCSKTGDADCKCDEKTPAQKSICPTCRGTGKVDGKPCPDCKGTGKGEMSEAKKKDDSYLEVNFKKRQKNNEKARKEMDKVPGQKNPHFESTGDQAYGSQEEVSEESTKEVAETETLLTFGQFDELYKGKHGQTEKQYQDSRSDAGKMVSGDSKSSGSRYAQGRRTSSDAGPQPAGGSKKPASQGKMDSGSRTDLVFRKAALKKKAAAKNEEVVNEEGADSLKDRRMERGGVGGNQRYNKPVSNTPNTFGKKKPKYDGMSAVEKVKASIEKQYGKGAIIDTKKKK